MGEPLEQITIKGFKSIRELEKFDLRPMNVLIGANGAGKSNFLSIFKLLKGVGENSFQDFVMKSGGADVLLYFGQKTTPEIEIGLKFKELEYSCKLAPFAGDSLYFRDEKPSYMGKPAMWTTPTSSLTAGKETSLVKYASEGVTIADRILSSMKDWQVYHFHDTSPGARMKKTVDINNNEVLHSDANNLAAFLYLLQETKPEYYQRITATVRLVAPFFNDFSLRPNPLNPNTVLLRWREKESGSEFNADVLSDGTLRFICLAALLLQPRLPSTILIDEPELGLHPYAINLLASLLQSAASQTQVIVSTQSVTLVNQFQPEDVIVVDRIDGRSIFTRYTQVDLDHWLDEYGMGDLWEKNVLRGRPR